jgi:hypothetical protein
MVVGLPPISWITYGHNHYRNHPVVYRPPHATVMEHMYITHQHHDESRNIARNACGCQVLTFTVPHEHCPLESHHAASQPQTGAGYRGSCSKKVRWALDPTTGSPNLASRPRHTILRASASKTVMTLPFTVIFTLAGEPCTVSFDPVDASKATLANFEAELEKAVSETLRHHLRSTLNIGYTLGIRRFTRRATLLIEGDDDVREASFKAFLNCVFRDATVILDCCSWGEPQRS